MVAFLLRRFAHGVIVLIAVSAVVFVLTHVAGDPLALLLPVEASPDMVAAVRERWGLDQPIYVQYLTYLSGLLRGDFGESIVTREPAFTMVADALGPMIRLAVASMVFSMSIAFPLGILAAIKQGTWIDGLARGLALLGQCMPNFYLGLILILFLSVRLQWFPPTGAPGGLGLVLPALTLGLYVTAETTRLVRSSMLEVLRSDYIEAAHARGIGQLRVIFRHALRNASLPVVTALGIQLGLFMGHTLVIEAVFAYPGLGFVVWRAIQNFDFLVIQAAVLIMTISVVAINLFVDVLYGWLDPRIREPVL